MSTPEYPWLTINGDRHDIDLAVRAFQHLLEQLAKEPA